MKRSNENCLLHNKQLIDTINSKLPLFTFDNKEAEQCLITLFRDYSFLASAYKLHQDYPSELPDVLSKPLIELSKKLNINPNLNYAYGYGLNNMVLKEPYLDQGHYMSYKTCRMFSNNEPSFIKVLVSMNCYSGELLGIQQSILENASKNSFRDLTYFLNKHYSVLNKIIESFQQVWNVSDYVSFFKRQVKNKTSEDTNVEDTNVEDPLIQDALITCVDALFGTLSSKNCIGRLNDYRPLDHRAYIQYNSDMSKEVRLLNTIYRDPNATFALLKNINALRLFRKIHWNLTKKHILSHPETLSNSHISWIPRQLDITINKLFEIIDHLDHSEINALSPTKRDIYTTLKLEMMEDRISLYADLKDQLIL
uniref:Uncharacterized protein n=1 Tax=viral metagenome TaxID=1070528 RepID=A0A6C0EJG6_9ZZZZ